MDLKKYIKPREDTEEPFAKEDAEFFNSLLIQTQQNAAIRAQTKRRVSLWKILTPIFSVVCVLTVSLTCIFTLTNKSSNLYLDENIVHSESTFIDIKSDLQYFDLDELENKAESILLMSDSLSKDKLYYSFQASLDFSDIRFYIVINKNYNYQFDLFDGEKSIALKDYTVTYSSEIVRATPYLAYRGYIKIKSETLYFEYEQRPALGDEAFFETLQQIIQVKS